MSMAMKYAMSKKKKHESHEEGIHHAHSEDKPGESYSGRSLRESAIAAKNADFEEADRLKRVAKSSHKFKLSDELPDMKGQNRKYLAEGGEVCEDHGVEMCEMCHGGECYADGGEVDLSDPEDRMAEPSPEPVPSPEPSKAPPNYDLSKAKKISQAFKNFAEGGDVVDHIMKQRSHMSKGGMVANDSEPMVDSEPAQYDDLVKDDHLEFHETGANSGDELGDKQEDMDRHDIVSMIMKSRKKKDHLPRPA